MTEQTELILHMIQENPIGRMFNIKTEYHHGFQGQFLIYTCKCVNGEVDSFFFPDGCLTDELSCRFYTDFMLKALEEHVNGAK